MKIWSILDGMLPIRKVNPTRVALSSYYGKAFVDRSVKVVHDYGKWLSKAIRTAGLDTEDNRVTNLKSASVVGQGVKVPRLYSILGQNFMSFTAGDIDFDLNYDKLEETFGADVVSQAKDQDMVPIGKRKRTPVLVDEHNTLYLLRQNDVEVLGDIEQVVDLDRSKAPVDVAELKVFGKSIPLGIALAYYIGIEQLVNSLDGTFRWVETGRRKELGADEFSIRFKDQTLILSRKDQLASLILGSLNNYKDQLKRYDVNDFNSEDVYFNLLESYGLSQRHLNELNLMRDMFVDPITKEILEGMGEPTVWLGLLRRSAELLLTDYSPRETDLSQMRIRGYERIAGAVYGELINSLRVFNGRAGNSNAAVELKPFAVWQAIQSDPSKVAVEESNPIKNINEQEAVTFTGAGGRSKVGMVGRTRVYNREDMGTISEATVDSGDVAINTYTTANPNLTSLRGQTSRWDGDQSKTSSLLSTSALLSPGATNDDQVSFLVE